MTNDQNYSLFVTDGTGGEGKDTVTAIPGHSFGVY